MDIGCYLGLRAHFQTAGRYFIVIQYCTCRLYKEIRGLLEDLDGHWHSGFFRKTILKLSISIYTFIIKLNILNCVIQNKTLVVLVCSFLVIIIVSALLSNAGILLAQITPFDERKTTTIMQSNSLVESIKDKRENVVSNIVFVVNSTIENKNQGQENITEKKGQEFTVTLESNPGTGYQWVPMFNTSIINLVSHNFQPSTTKLMGSPGIDVFKFKAINSGTESLKMVYKRSWEKEFVKQKVFVINVT